MIVVSMGLRHRNFRDNVYGPWSLYTPLYFLLSQVAWFEVMRFR